MTRSLFRFFMLGFLLISINLVNAQTFQSFNTSNSDLPSNNVKALYTDPYGHLWIGTNEGLVLYKDNEFTVYTPASFVELADKNINDLGYQWSAYSSKHEIWVATENGITVSYFDETGLPLDAVTGATIYRTDKDSDGKLLSNTVKKVHLDANYTRWFATDLGVSIYKGQTWDSITPKSHPNSIPNSPITAIGSYKKNDEVKVFIGTNDRIGRVTDKVDGISGATFLEQPWENGLNNTSQDIRSIAVVDTIQWYGTSNGLTYKNGWETKTGWGDFYDERLENQIVNCLHVLPSGRAFAGTLEKGIFVVDNDFVIANLTLDNDLPSNTIQDIEINSSGRIWVATDAGLAYTDDAVVSSRNIFKNNSTQLEIYPNPASQYVTIGLQIDSNSPVSFQFYDMNGRLVNQVSNMQLAPGYHQVKWNLTRASGEIVPSGIYFVKCISKTGEFASGKILIQ